MAAVEMRMLTRSSVMMCSEDATLEEKPKVNCEGLVSSGKMSFSKG